MIAAERRAFPRLEVIDELNGELVPFGVPLTVKDVSAGGFSVESEARFVAGRQHRFRFTTVKGDEIVLEASVMHCRLARSPGATGYITGFEFVRRTSTSATAVSVLLDSVAAPDATPHRPAASPGSSSI